MSPCLFVTLFLSIQCAVPLSVVKKKGKDLKAGQIDQIRKYVEEYKNIFIFSYDHLKTQKLQSIRTDWTGSR